LLGTQSARRFCRPHSAIARNDGFSKANAGRALAIEEGAWSFADYETHQRRWLSLRLPGAGRPDLQRPHLVTEPSRIASCCQWARKLGRLLINVLRASRTSESVPRAGGKKGGFLRDPPARRVNARVAGDPGELHALAEGIDKLWVTADHDCAHACHRAGKRELRSRIRWRQLSGRWLRALGFRRFRNPRFVLSTWYPPYKL
jgi:hypothetical protein